MDHDYKVGETVAIRTGMNPYPDLGTVTRVTARDVTVDGSFRFSRRTGCRLGVLPPNIDSISPLTTFTESLIERGEDVARVQAAAQELAAAAADILRSVQRPDVVARGSERARAAVASLPVVAG